MTDNHRPAADRLPMPGFGWRERIWLLLADLLVFDARRLGWRLAIRTVIGLLAPLALARLLNIPALSWVGIGAFLVAFGDSTDDGDRQQPLRLVVGTVLGGLAVASGVLCGSALLMAVLGMFFWGGVAGLIGAYGNAFATMGLPIALAYVELGLPTRDHSLAEAAALGTLFVLGGGLAMICTWLVRIVGPYAPLRQKTADCFRTLATYLHVVGGASGDGPPDLMSSETPVRATIAEARRVAAELRRSQHAWSGVAQRSVVLIELADRLFSLGSALREACEAEVDQHVTRTAPFALFADAALQLAGALCSPAKAQGLSEALAELDRVAADAQRTIAPATRFGVADINRRMAADLSRAIRIVAGDAMPEGAPELPVASAARGLSQSLAPLAACLDHNSVVGRHALRFGVVAAASVVVFWAFPPPFGYWIPLTVTVVLKPYAGVTLARTVQRIAGTVAGIVVGSAIMPLVTDPATALAAMAFAFFWMMATLPFNYFLAILFLSAGLIPFEHFLTPDLEKNVALLRLAATGIGAALAMVGGHVLWPTFESKSLPVLLRSSILSMAAYAERVLSGANGPAKTRSVEAMRRQAGLDISNLRASIQRSVSEIGGDAGMLHAAMLAAAALQRLFDSFNAVANVAPILAPASSDVQSFRDALVSRLKQLGEEGQGPECDLPSHRVIEETALRGPGRWGGSDAEAATTDFLGYEFGRIAAQVGLLAVALARIKGPA
jgi:uncharacterized membrane protein YccC